MSFMRSDYKPNKSRNRIIIISISIALIAFFLQYILKKDNTTEVKKEPIQEKKKSKKNISLTKTILSKKKVSKGFKKSMNLNIKNRNIKNSIVLVTSYDAFDKNLRTGTGFALSRNRIVTNRHIIAGAKRVEVKIKGNVFYIDGIYDSDLYTDKVLLSIPNSYKKLKTQNTLSSQFSPKKGKSVFFASNPLGNKATISTDFISAIRQIVPFGKVYQITAPILSSSNGSPVFNEDGGLLGVITPIYYKNKKFNFIVPLPYLNGKEKKKISSLKEIDFTEFYNLETSYEKGEFLLSNNEYKKAYPFLEKALKEEPEDNEILINLGICYREIGRNDKAIKIFKDLIKKDYEIIQVNFELGVTYIKFEMYDKALSSLKFVYKNDPDYENLNMQLGIVLNKMEDYKNAVYYLKKAAEFTDNPEVYYFLGLNHSKINQIHGAIRAIRNAIKIDDYNVKYLLELGILYYDDENFQFSIDTLKKGRVLDFHNCDIHFHLGFAYLGNKDLKNARLEWHQVRDCEGVDDNFRRSSKDIKLDNAINEYIDSKRKKHW